jgi:hypothetical protein
MLVSTELVTRDPSAAAAFYGAVFGWSFAPSAQGGLDCFVSGNRIARITPAAPASNATTRDHWLPVYGTRDLERSARQAVAAGGSVLRSSGDRLVIQEPGGAVSGLAGIGRGMSPAPVSDRRHGRMWWRSLNVRDAEAARLYHQRIDGWRFRRLPMQDASYLLAYADSEPTAGIYPMSGPLFEGLPDNWLVYVAVDDCDRAVAAAVAAGGAVIHAARPIRLVCRLAVVTDPGGAPVALAEPKPGFLQERTLPLLRLIRPR